MPRLLLLLMIILAASFCYPSIATSSPAPLEASSRNDSVVGFGKRFSFHTNVIDWCIAMPNVGVEWDFSGKRTSRYSIGVHAKYRPATWNKVSPRFVFNTLQVRGEFRRYWRTFVYEDYDNIQRDTTVGVFRRFFSYLRYKRMSGARPRRARNWRAYFVGLYVEADKFTYHLADIGRQGKGAGFGVTAGYTLPLYPMRKGGSIDLDLGLSIGARIQSYDKFSYEEETHCYVYTGAQERSFVKHPVLADAHVALVYRLNSISNKVQDCDKRFEKKMARWAERRLRRDDAAGNRSREKAEKKERDKFVADSVSAAKKLDKEKNEREKAAAKEKKKADEKRKIEEKAKKEAEKKAAKEEAAREKEGKKKQKESQKKGDSSENKVPTEPENQAIPTEDIGKDKEGGDE